MSLDALPSDGQRWFALRVKSRSEHVVATAARNKGFEAFLPLYEARRHWSDRIKKLQAPLFPGYLFCRLNPEHRLPLLTIPGVMQFVGLGRTPVPIEDAEIAAIDAALRSGLGLEPWPFLDVGQRIRVEYGPLAGLEGILVEKRKQRRIVISVALLQRSVGVEIESDWVRPVKPAGRPLALPAAPAC